MHTWDLVQGTTLTFHDMADDFKEFRSSRHGNYQSNPYDPKALTPSQAQNSVDLGFPSGTEHFEVTYQVTPGVVMGRNLLFAGVPAMMFCREDKAYMDIENSQLLYSNLGRKGPDFDAPEGIRYGGVLQRRDGRLVDLVVNALSDSYAPQWNARNGKAGKVGQVNLPSLSTADFQFSLIDAETSQLTSVRNVLFSVFDLDMGRGSNLTERLTIGGFSMSYIADSSELSVETLLDGRKTYRSSTYGIYEDNPIDPLDLTEQQAKRSVTYLYQQASQWTVGYSSGDGPQSGRNFRFAGTSELLHC
jgi:hypothetical protein